MAKILPPHYVQLVSDAALKSFWRRRSLHDFLRRSGVRPVHLATWTEEDTKRDFLAHLFPLLESSDAGIGVVNGIADALAEQGTFPDLDGWEDSETKKKQAAGAVAALRAYLRAKREDAAAERDQQETRRRVQAIREQQARQRQDLAKLDERIKALAQQLGSQQAGYAFQNWFYDLVDYFEVPHRRPYVAEGRQIDGSVTVDGTTYLVELKFTEDQASAPDVDSLYKKVLDKADNTMGIMVSVAGYSSTAIADASGPRTPVLLLDHKHIYALLTGLMTFSELVNRVRRHASQTGEAYLDPTSFGS
jgi:hypothetical protein